jgi:hypothetical protein
MVVTRRNCFPLLKRIEPWAGFFEFFKDDRNEKSLFIEIN